MDNKRNDEVSEEAARGFMWQIPRRGLCLETKLKKETIHTAGMPSSIDEAESMSSCSIAVPREISRRPSLRL